MAGVSTIQNISTNISPLISDNNTNIISNISKTNYRVFTNNKFSRFPYEIIIRVLLFTDLKTSISFSSLCHRFRQIGIPFKFIQKVLIDKDLALLKSNSFLEYLYHYYTKPSYIKYFIKHSRHCSFMFSKEQLRTIYESAKLNQYRFSDFSFNNNCCIIRSVEIGNERLFRFFLSHDPYHYPVLLATSYTDFLYSKINGKSCSDSEVAYDHSNNPNEKSSSKSMLYLSSDDNNIISNNLLYTSYPYTLYQKTNYLPFLNCTYEYCNRCCCRCGLLKVNSKLKVDDSQPYFCRCNTNDNGVAIDNTTISNDERTEKEQYNLLNDTDNSLSNSCSIPGCNCYYHKDEDEKENKKEENDIIQISRGRHICINTSDRSDRAFCQACANGHLNIVKLLLSITHPKLVNTQAHNNYAIINAASNGHVEVVKLLLSLKGDRKVDISANDHAAFVWACCYGHIDVVKELLKEPNINTQAQNNSAFIWACNNGRLEIVKLLLSLKGNLAIDPVAQNNRAIVSACNMGNIQIVKALLEYGENGEEGIDGELLTKVDPTVNNNQAFITACSNGSLEIIKMLLALEGERAINPVDQHNEAFINACTNGHQEIVELLLNLKGKYEVDPSDQDNKAFIRACSYGNLNIVRLLLSLPHKGIDPTAQQNLAFINACLCGYYDIVKELLTLSHIDFSCIENDITTNCDSKTLDNSLNVLSSTNETSSESNDTDHSNKCENDNNESSVETHKILNPINPNDRDNQAFIEACSYGQVKVVKLLLSLKGKYRVDPSAQNYQALIKAAINGHQNVVRLILSIDDDRKINKKEPIETSIRLVNDYNYSQKQNYQAILSYLKDHLAKI